MDETTLRMCFLERIEVASKESPIDVFFDNEMGFRAVFGRTIRGEEMRAKGMPEYIGTFWKGSHSEYYIRKKLGARIH